MSRFLPQQSNKIAVPVITKVPLFMVLYSKNILSISTPIFHSGKL